MRTPQGIMTRRKFVGGLAVRLAVFTLAFACLLVAARGLVGDQLSDMIADMGSTWVEVPDESAVWYRMNSYRYQEGSMQNGHATFRDLSDYRAIVDFIEGPLAWGTYAAGLVVVSIAWSARCARTVDELTSAVARAAMGEEIRLDGELAAAGEEFERLAAYEKTRELAVQAAETRKNELVAYLAHDIKTPLTSVIGYLALLAEEPDLPQDRRERYAVAALDRASRLDAMMDEFFEITRYNLGAIPLEREWVDLRLLVSQVADELYPAAHARAVTVEVDSLAGVRAFIDPSKMARVLGNVMKNGIAFAERGSAVRCRVEQDADSVRIDVENRGREISSLHLKSIFEKFYREDASRGADGGHGAGLGLAIAKEIVEAHGGTIAASSAAGVTTFSIALPTPTE